MTDYEQGLYGFLEQDLDAMLERAKAHPLKVHLDFDTRFRVWKDEVVVNRFLYLDKHPYLSTASRMYELIVRDVIRLLKRNLKELMEVADIPDYSKKHVAHLRLAQSLYNQRREMVLDVYSETIKQITEKKLRR